MVLVRHVFVDEECFDVVLTTDDISIIFSFLTKWKKDFWRKRVTHKLVKIIKEYEVCEDDDIACDEEVGDVIEKDTESKMFSSAAEESACSYMQCTSPIRLRNQFFPCGHCLSCRISKAREWSARLLHELNYWDKSVFVTLTYDNEHLPPHNSLVKKDLQKFFKRLRKCSNAKLKYYACGEYGENKAGIDYGHGLGRPHYHCIIFGLGQNKIDEDFIKDAWRNCIWDNFQESKAFGTVTYDSCRYVSDYIFKKYSGEKLAETYTNKGIEPPFKISSTGLGLRFCLENAENLKHNMSFTLRGVPMNLPRYYVDKLKIQLESQDKRELQKWRNYAHLHNIPDSDIAELKDSMRRQRAIDVERKSQLFTKGEL